MGDPRPGPRVDPRHAVPRGQAERLAGAGEGDCEPPRRPGVSLGPRRWNISLAGSRFHFQLSTWSRPWTSRPIRMMSASFQWGMSRSSRDAVSGFLASTTAGSGWRGTMFRFATTRSPETSASTEFPSVMRQSPCWRARLKPTLEHRGPTSTSGMRLNEIAHGQSVQSADRLAFQPGMGQGAAARSLLRPGMGLRGTRPLCIGVCSGLFWIRGSPGIQTGRQGGRNAS